jgi:hypothetical protein
MLNKSSRPKLKLQLQIHEVSSIPLVTGQIFVKWHILHSSSGECRGKTDRVPIIDHKAGWSNYQKECTFKVGIGRNGVLQERWLMMEAWVEMISGRERFRIGTVAVNLSEYASVKSETRRYLLQESKMNSTVKVTIAVVHVEGAREYTTPPLKKAQMFHGITNLLAENKDLPQISRGIEQYNSKHVLHSPIQEMYRRTFSAQWRLQAGGLPPSDVVEDIFKGGSGWKSDFASSMPKLPERKINQRTESGTSVRPTARELRRPPSGQFSSTSLYQRTHIPISRPITPLSPDEQSDFEDDEGEEWIRQETNSHRTAHFRTASMVTITPRHRKRNLERENIITSESWEREELETGPRSWKTPNLEVLEYKIEARRLARESRGTPSFASAPGSSGKISSTDRSASLSGSIVSEVIVEDDEKNEIMSADDTDISD